MYPEVRDGAGCTGQGEKPRPPCGRIVSRGFAENQTSLGRLYWRLKAWLNSGCGLSFDRLVALIWWAFEWFRKILLLLRPLLPSVQAGSSWRLRWFAGQSLAGSWRLVFQRCDLHIFVNEDYICASGIQQEEPTRHPCCSASIHVSPPLELLSCFAERPGKILGLWNSGILARLYFASSSTHSRGLIVLPLWAPI